MWRKHPSKQTWLWVVDGDIRQWPCVTYHRGYFEVWSRPSGYVSGDQVIVDSRHERVEDAQAAAGLLIRAADAPPAPVQGKLL